MKKPPETIKPGTLGYAQWYHMQMTNPEPREGETPEQAKSRAEQYAGVDEDGFPID